VKPGTPIVCVDELGERFAAAVSTVELHLRRARVEDVVIDTNVFVAAGFNSKSAAARVFEGVREGRFRLIWNEPTRRETEIIVRRIPRLDWASIADLFQPEAEFARQVDLEAFTAISDPDDRKFVALSAAGGRGRGRHRSPDAARFSGTKGRIRLVTGSSARRPTTELCSRSVTGPSGGAR
jgi:predicted nucleic acid-binding protein